ncbi:VOC family protein [Lacticaseibacillus saniviri]|uniref:VOC family protein n=1 Tax=Lacticaseibacillus saniviri TaxID=931533 RepID=UPI0007049851|nr:VOC family protein [Lacticaseibacillus saniviri]
MSTIELAPETRIGFVAMRVADLEKMATWYQEVAQLAVLKRESDQIFLGTRTNQQVLVILRQIAKGDTTQATGLDHFAIVLPNPGALGAAHKHINQVATVVNRFKNGYSKGFEVVDPEGNGIEFIIDEAIEQFHEADSYNWQDEDTKTIKAEELERHVDKDYSGVPSGSSVGHVQFRIRDLAATEQYLVSGLGFQIKPAAAKDQIFLAAGDYHHHIGITLRVDAKLPVATPTSLGLDYVNFVVPSAGGLDAIIANLNEQGISDYQYDEAHHYLMIAGPNQLTLWFTVA